MNKGILVGDVGGTYSRWATYRGGLGPVSIVKTAASRTLAEAVEGRLGDSVACGVAVAGPIADGAVHLTNASWSGTEDDLAVPVALVNDLEAVALAVPALVDQDLTWFGAEASPGKRILCLGVGTGFGGALWEDGRVVAMEPGHETLGYFEPLGRVCTVEEAVSGTAIRALEAAGTDIESVVPEAFRVALGRLVERLVPDSVLLVGGVIEGRPHLFGAARTAGVPVAQIVHPHPALLGAANAARLRL